MSADLPTHVATADEAIPNPGAPTHGDGPDMRAVMSIEAMLADLREFDGDEVGYVIRWRQHLAAIGASVLLHYARDGERGLTLGMPCDLQARHRNRWAHFLMEDLDADEHRRPVLLAMLQREALSWDERPVDAATTTRAMRGFLRTGGRILVTPDGQVTEGGGMLRSLLVGDAEHIREAAAEQRAYFDVRRRYRADRQIKRAVRMLGRRTSGGWLELAVTA